MAYQYEKVNHELLVPQIEDQLMMYMKQENIAIGEKLPSEYKLAELFGVGRSTIREAVKRDRKSTRLNSSHRSQSRMPSSA